MNMYYCHLSLVLLLSLLYLIGFTLFSGINQVVIILLGYYYKSIVMSLICNVLVRMVGVVL